MPENKKHHYVPKFHLRNFSIDKNGKELRICRKFPFLVIPAGELKNQGYVDYFYGEKNEFEKTLGLFEDEVSKIIQGIISTESLPKRGSDQYFSLRFHTMSQQSRTKNAADTIDRIIGSTMNAIAKDNPIFEKYGKELNFEMQNPIFDSLHSLAMSFPKTEDLDCKLLINKSQTPFLTSDCPVILYNQFLERKKQPGGHLGLATRGLQVFFPIHPQYALIYYDEPIYNIGYKKRKTVITHNTMDIDSINLLQYLTADKVLFGNEKISEHYLKKLDKEAARSPWKKEYLSNITTEHYPDGSYSELHHNYMDNPSIGLKLSFIKETSKAKTFKSTGYAVELRQDNRKQY